MNTNMVKKTKKSSQPVDFHAHLLPGLDDGCQTKQESYEQLQAAARCGIRTIVVTPHYYPQRDTVEVFLQRRAAAVDELTGGCLQLVSLRLGAEVLLWPGIDRMEGLEKLCISGSQTLLLELPYGEAWGAETEATVFRLARRYQVVLAHPERYPPAEVRRLLGANLWLQPNASSFYRPRARRRLRQLLGSGKQLVLGSDNHGRQDYYQKFMKVLKRLERRQWEITATAEALLEA